MRLPDTDRRRILRRDALRRQMANDLRMLGAIDLVASISLPANGVALTWTAAEILAAAGVVAVALAFVLLGSIGPLSIKRLSPPLDAGASG